MSNEPVVRCTGCGARWGIKPEAADSYKNADVVMLPPCPKCGGERVIDDPRDSTTNKKE